MFENQQCWLSKLWIFFKVNIIPHTWFPHPKMACSLPRSDTGTQLKKLQDLMQRFELFCAYVCVFSWIGSIWTHFQNKLTWLFMIYIIFCCLVCISFWFYHADTAFSWLLGNNSQRTDWWRFYIPKDAQ